MVATTLRRGQIAVVSFESDLTSATTGDNDALRVVLLGPIGSGTVFYLTDRNWTGTAFPAAGSGDGTLTYTAATDLAAGTVLTFTRAQLNAVGMTLSSGGDTLYLFQGPNINTPTTFLHAVDIADGNTTFNGNLTGTGLTAGVSAVAVQFDNASYAGSATQIYQSMFSSINVSARWHGTDLDDTHPGTPFYTEVTDTNVGNPGDAFPESNNDTFFNAQDMVLIAGMAGGGQSDAILRVGRDEGASVGSNLTRMFRDNPAFNHITDVTFDIENGFFFFVDSDGNSINRIMRGNIADLVTGSNNPSFTQLFATDGFGEVMTGIEINTTTNQIYWWDGDLGGNFEGGWQLLRTDYNGGNLTQIALLDAENPDPTFGIPGGIGDWALDSSRGFAYVVSSQSVVDGLGNATVTTNHILRVTLSTGVITVMALDNADPRSFAAGGGYNNGRLDPNEGQIMALDVDQDTGIVYFITQPISASASGGIFKYDPVADDLTELWNQPSNNAHNTLQSFPTANMTHIEYDEIADRYYVSATSDSDTENDATPLTNESDAAIFIGNPAGGAPTLFVRAYEPTANGAPQGMEIDYAPTVTAVGDNSTYTESTNLPNSPAGTPVDVADTFVVGDVDTGTIQSATVAITGGFLSGDTLGFTNSGGITGTYSALTGLLTFTGATSFANYQTVLDSVTFTNAGDNPTNYGYDNTRTISFQVFDGLAYSDPATAVVNVVGINDAPVNNGMGSGFAGGAEDNNGTALGGITITDVDADPAAHQISVQLTVSHGTLTLLNNVANGLTGGMITNNGSANVLVIGTQNQINTTLGAANGLVYIPTTNFNGNDTLAVFTVDNGHTGNDPGGVSNTSEQDIDNQTIVVTAVNDAPTVTTATETLAAILEDADPAGATVSSLLTDNFSDATDNQAAFGGSSANGLAGIAVITNGSSGSTGQWQYFRTSDLTWQNIGTPGAGSATFVRADTLIRFKPALDYNGNAPTLVAHLVDDSAGAPTVNGSGINLIATPPGGTSNLSSGTVTLNQAITAVNDAPKNVPGATVNINEGATNVVLSTTGSAMSVSDVDNPTDPIVYSLTVLHGILTVAENVPGGVADVDITGNGTGSIVITATLAQINTTLASSNALLYTPATDYNGADPLAVYVNDDGQTGLDPGGPAIDPIVVGPVTEEDLDLRAINIAAQNDTPVVPDRGPLTVDEQIAEPLLGGVTVSDVDLDALNSGNGDYGGASFTISRNGGANASDVFSLTGGANFTVDGTDLKTTVGGLVFGTITSNSAGQIVIDFTSSAAPATSDLVDEVIQAIQYKIDNDNPPASVDLKYVLDDGSPDAVQGGGAQAASDFGLVTVQINPIDDEAVAVDDVKTTDEATSTVITVLGNDTDPDGPSSPSVMEIEGTPVADGDVINLLSGAKLTYHADGTITYDPNGAFDDLAEFGTNASNQSRTDSFEYEINSGDIATVVVTVKGLYSTPHILEGTAGIDTITGTANNDIFALSADGDSMTGGAGDDAYRIDHAGDTVVELANEGTDKVFTALAVHNLESNVENLAGTVNTGQTLNGNALDNVIVAGTGADTLSGGLGDDRLDGGAGADDMAGGDGDDLYYIDNIGDDIDESLTTGTDRVRSSISYTLGTNVENLVLTGAGNLDGTGNGDANAITGNTGSNRLDGGAGVDILNGGTGNDTYVVDSASDSVIESTGGGTDTVESSVTYHLSNTYEIEKLTLTGVGAINGFGNSLNNVLTGNNAANLLNADGGVDQMIGLGGNDTYVVDNTSDVVTEAALGGTDTVESSANYTLSNEVEKLVLAGTGDLNGTGNGGANTLVGNNGMNRLDGGAGVDSMNGRGGNDTYVVDNTGDSVIETIGGGTDTVESSVTYTLSEKYETENLTLTGSNPINGFGNGLANTLTGNSASNLLSGRGGDDDMYGKAGNDTLYGGDGANDFYFDTALNAATNVDRLVDYTVADDTIMLSDAIFTAAGPAGALAATAFQAGPVALDVDDRILYDLVTGNIYYDADGSAGGSAAILFAQVGAGTLLTVADFTIFTG